MLFLHSGGNPMVSPKSFLHSGFTNSYRLSPFRISVSYGLETLRFLIQTGFATLFRVYVAYAFTLISPLFTSTLPRA